MPSKAPRTTTPISRTSRFSRHAEGAVGELQQLVGHGRGQALDLGDAVTGLGDDADLLAGDLGRVRGDEALQRSADLVGRDGQLGHPLLPYSGSCVARECGSVLAGERGAGLGGGAGPCRRTGRSRPGRSSRRGPSGSTEILRTPADRRSAARRAPSRCSSASVSGSATVTYAICRSRARRPARPAWSGRTAKVRPPKPRTASSTSRTVTGWPCPPAARAPAPDDARPATVESPSDGRELGSPATTWPKRKSSSSTSASSPRSRRWRAARRHRAARSR